MRINDAGKSCAGTRCTATVSRRRVATTIITIERCTHMTARFAERSENGAIVARRASG